MESQTLLHEKEGNTYAGSSKQELGLTRWRSAVGLPEVLFDMSGRRDAEYEWGTAEDEKPDYRVLPTTFPAPPFHRGRSDRPFNTSIQGHVVVCQNSFIPGLERLRQTSSYQRNNAVGTSASANTPLSLRSPSCPVSVCNGNEVFARPSLGLDIDRSGRTPVYDKKTTNTSRSPSGRCRNNSLCKHPIFSAFT